MASASFCTPSLRRFIVGSVLTAATLGSVVLLTRTSSAVDHPVDPMRPSEAIRYGLRQGVEVPAHAIVPEIQRRGTTNFASEVDVIVARLDLPTYDGYLKAISGWDPIVVGGNPFTIQTRYSTAAAGQVCWQYAYETLQALGYDVRYQNYTRAGNNLKNIIATIPGQVTPENIYVIGGHIDSISQNPSTLAPGAEDNGSGTAGVLAAAAALVGEQFESTIELVLFSGEEQGLWGSDAYVDDAIANDRNVLSAVTMDMIAAWVNDYGVLIEGESAWQPLMLLMADAVDTYTTIDRDFSYFSFGSDHVPFQDAGIPAILAIDLDWASYGPYHRTTDTYDKTTPALGTSIAKASLAAVAQLAVPFEPVVDTPEPMLTSLRAYPNPASREVTISLAQDDASWGRASSLVRVFDVAGREVRSLPASTVAASGGSSAREVTWDLRDGGGNTVRPGLYWVRMGAASQKVVVIP